MKKILIIIGTNADFAYNRYLAHFIAKRYAGQVSFQVQEIKDIPLFDGNVAPDSVIALREAVETADGVIICTPEYDRAIPSSLKSALEWLGAHAGTHVMNYKKVMVVGAALSAVGASNAQEDLREVLMSPDLAANVLPGNEVLIGHVQDKIDKKTGDFASPEDLMALDHAFESFMQFMK